ncbi:hypothetical protein [Caldisphaera sp.]|uniref:hypothetical protein n=1 Tax=Caldisphaera sp. TaxID=2060322 RepID=UPI00397A03CD
MAINREQRVRRLSTRGMILVFISFLLMMTLNFNFPYPEFALFLFLACVGNGFFVYSNTPSIMNSVLPNHSGIVLVMRAVMANIANVISINLHFSLLLLL